MQTVFDHSLDNRRAEQLNRDCHCVALNRPALQRELSRQTDGDELYRMMTEERPHLISDVAVFVAEANLHQQQEIIHALETVIAMPAYQDRVLAYAPASAQFKPKAQGVYLGYDFHLGEDGPRLIEINSNAGGAMINLCLSGAHLACNRCPGQSAFAKTKVLEQTYIEMFLQEWALEGHAQPLRNLAIVDESPQQQYLWPEFKLFQNLFARHGIRAVICDPSELSFHNGKLWHDKISIDLVYNRLTDFSLQQPAHQALLEAYLADAVVITPHPRNHALYADKRNLALLSDPLTLQALGVDPVIQATLLDGIAKTSQVESKNADSLWQQRKQLFFKPAKGFGSKAAYRGDKLTKRVFAEILQGDYVAQTLVHPSERQFLVADQTSEFKLDVRHYVYQGQTQSICARLYQGQTTNFRTPGGGFAQVVIVPEITQTSVSPSPTAC
jgi:hypothetical protein